jgi:hypothetical protein
VLGEEDKLMDMVLYIHVQYTQSGVDRHNELQNRGTRTRVRSRFFCYVFWPLVLCAVQLSTRYEPPEALSEFITGSINRNTGISASQIQNMSVNDILLITQCTEGQTNSVR